MILDIGTLPIASAYQGSITFLDETAGFRNTLGMYRIDERGNISDVQVIFGNTSHWNSGGSLVAGESAIDVSFAEDDMIGFFIVPNSIGYENGALALDENANWVLRDEAGDLATIQSEGRVTLWHVAKDGTESELPGQYDTTWHSIGREDNDFALNVDGYDHTRWTLEIENGRVVLDMAFEDLWATGDRDFTDVVFRVDIGPVNTAVVAATVGKVDIAISNHDMMLLTSKGTGTLDLTADGDVPGDVTIKDIQIERQTVQPGQTVTLSDGNVVTFNADLTVTATGANTHIQTAHLITYTILDAEGGEHEAFLSLVTSPVDGTEGDDTIVKYTDADGNMIDGTDGASELIFGYGGNDKIFAESGNDEIHGGSGNDFIRADDGDDEIYGGTGNDVLDGGTGADTMEGGAGNDVYYIDNAGDVISEARGDGHDKVHSTLTHTLADGFEDLWLKGTDAIDGTGNAARNMIVGNNKANVIEGLGGNDNLIGEGGNDTLRGGEGNDKLHGGNGADEMHGDAGNDKLHGGFGNDVVYGGIGNDMLCPGAGDDTMFGGEGNDLLSGNAGADVAYGGLGNDTYKVTDALDTIVEYADEGTDVVHANVSFTLGEHVENLRLMGNGDISATGNDDANRLNGNGGDNAMAGEGGNDHMNGRGGNDAMTGGAGNDRMNGNGGNDTLDGGADNDHVSGGAGNDVLLGGAGNDRLFGGSGADELTGGEGDDVLKGQGGADVFVFATGAGDDKIRGYSAEDSLRFEGLSADDLTVTEQRNGTLIEYGNDDSILIVNAHDIDTDTFTFV